MIEGFHAPGSIDEALGLARTFGSAGVLLSGGTEVLAADYPRNVVHVIDLARLGLDEIGSQGGCVIVGARCTLQRVVESGELPPGLRAAAANVRNRSIRNVATVGGQIASLRPVGDLVPALLALDAEVEAVGDAGVLREPVAAWMAAPRGIVVSLRLPGPFRPLAVRRFARSPSDRPILVVAVSLDRDGDRVLRPIVAVGGAGSRGERLPSLEALLDGQPLPDGESIEAAAAALLDPPSDFKASGALKRHVAGVLVARAVRAAFGGEGAAQ